jgi:hypothetical protein
LNEEIKKELNGGKGRIIWGIYPNKKWKTPMRHCGGHSTKQKEKV